MTRKNRQALQRIRRKYSKIFDQQVIGPVKRELRRERTELLQGLDDLGKKPAPAPYDQDREITERWLKENLKRIEKFLEQLEADRSQLVRPDDE